jgi:hypothetical protein
MINDNKLFYSIDTTGGRDGCQKAFDGNQSGNKINRLHDFERDAANSRHLFELNKVCSISFHLPLPV